MEQRGQSGGGQRLRTEPGRAAWPGAAGVAGRCVAVPAWTGAFSTRGTCPGQVQPPEEQGRDGCESVGRWAPKIPLKRCDGIVMLFSIETVRNSMYCLSLSSLVHVFESKISI